MRIKRKWRYKEAESNHLRFTMTKEKRINNDTRH